MRLITRIRWGRWFETRSGNAATVSIEIPLIVIFLVLFWVVDNMIAAVLIVNVVEEDWSLEGEMKAGWPGAFSRFPFGQRRMERVALSSPSLNKSKRPGKIRPRLIQSNPTETPAEFPGGPGTGPGTDWDPGRGPGGRGTGRGTDWDPSRGPGGRGTGRGGGRGGGRPGGWGDTAGHRVAFTGMVSIHFSIEFAYWQFSGYLKWIVVDMWRGGPLPVTGRGFVARVGTCVGTRGADTCALLTSVDLDRFDTTWKGCDLDNEPRLNPFSHFADRPDAGIPAIASRSASIRKPRCRISTASCRR